MDGRGRAFDNIIVERLWRTVKYEEVYIKRYETGFEAFNGLKKYIQFYNEQRPHSSLGGRTPAEIYRKRGQNSVERKGESIYTDYANDKVAVVPSKGPGEIYFSRPGGRGKR